ncbi:hypothetical protein [Hymenobacter crusticola]|uniref:DoxX family protein n=1 Tax=Hymenobacter crusticola TaxID=1770526 RepID=A0A243W7W9_9BACT|nr:hypothetical protein [Hymenobacter crusticola]OUJ68718.1 hypothetical protein BXP70_27505 [Hymenobacter crusticola]
MIKSLLSLALLLVSVGLSFKHGWDAFTAQDNPQALHMMRELGIGESLVPILGSWSGVTGMLLLLPKTFFWGNVLNAVSIVVIMALAIRAGKLPIV